MYLFDSITNGAVMSPRGMEGSALTATFDDKALAQGRKVRLLIEGATAGTVVVKLTTDAPFWAVQRQLNVTAGSGQNAVVKLDVYSGGTEGGTFTPVAMFQNMNTAQFANNLQGFTATTGGTLTSPTGKTNTFSVAATAGSSQTVLSDGTKFHPTSTFYLVFTITGAALVQWTYSQEFASSHFPF